MSDDVKMILGILTGIVIFGAFMLFGSLGIVKFCERFSIDDWIPAVIAGVFILLAGTFFMASMNMIRPKPSVNQGVELR